LAASGFVFLDRSGGQRLLPSLPTRRSSDLSALMPSALYRVAAKSSTAIGRLEGASPLRSVSPTVIPVFSGPPPAVMNIAEDADRSEEHTSELQSHLNLVCRLLLEERRDHQR